MLFWIVNAFANCPGKGGGAGVFIYDSFPEDSEMIRLSSELGFSNSAFLVKIDDNKYKLRWFTPLSEAKICGHATLAAGHVLFSENLVRNARKITFESASGKLYIEQIKPNFYQLNFPVIDYTEVQPQPNWLETINQKPIFTAIDGVSLIMDFGSFDTLKNLKVDLSSFSNLAFRALIATASGFGNYNFASRYFAPKVGINEDPVCVSAHSRLIPYWAKKLNKNNLIAFQASARTAKLLCTLADERVLISGSGFTVYKGEITETNFKEKAKLS
jgi:predicted PhzF superfamily epimerase YddE/YHI9